MFSITEIIEIAVQLEKNGEKVYREAIGQSKNIEMDDLLLGIAEELEHIDWFLSLKDEIEKSQDRLQVKEMEGHFPTGLHSNPLVMLKGFLIRV